MPYRELRHDHLQLEHNKKPSRPASSPPIQSYITSARRPKNAPTTLPLSKPSKAANPCKNSAIPTRPNSSRENGMHYPYQRRDWSFLMQNVFTSHWAARTAILEQLHAAHCGLQKTWETAKSMFFWPGIKEQIKQCIQKCEQCQKFRPSQPAEPLIQTTADFPMHKVSAGSLQS